MQSMFGPSSRFEVEMDTSVISQEGGWMQIFLDHGFKGCADLVQTVRDYCGMCKDLILGG